MPMYKKKPIRVFWSPLTKRFFASQYYKELPEENAVEITGEKFDVTSDIERYIEQLQNNKINELTNQITLLKETCGLFEQNSQEASEVFEVLVRYGLVPAEKSGPRMCEIVENIIKKTQHDL